MESDAVKGPFFGAKTKSPIWLCVVFPPLAVWGKGWVAVALTSLLFLYGWAPAIPAALYYNS